MIEDFEKFVQICINGIKGLMQPMFSLVTAWGIIFLLINKLIDFTLAFWLFACVLAYWYADKQGFFEAIISKFTGVSSNGNSASVNSTASQANTTNVLAETTSTQAYALNNAIAGLSQSVPVSALNNTTPIANAAPGASTAQNNTVPGEPSMEDVLANAVASARAEAE